MKIIDLTYTFTTNMPIFPSDRSSHITQITSIEKDGLNDHTLTTAMHVGTHMDAPYHMIEGGKKISELDPKIFIGNGRLIDAQGRKEVDVDCLNNVDVSKGDIVLVLTGQGAKFRDVDYFDSYPELTKRFAIRLIELKVKLVGLDTPSPDKPPFMIHKILLNNGTPIIENLTNIEQLKGVNEFEVIALPMKLDTDAAPVRVVAHY